ncbi:synaptonemal complex protein 2 isoform X2 [Paroedura picta]
MVNWFEKVKEIIENRINEKNDNFTTVIEDFFDVLMTVHDTSSEGKMQILENFILRTCTLTADSRINIYIRQEAVRKLNSMLDAMPRDTRKKIISTKGMLHIMNEMGKRVLDAGDYDLQVAITEALCRMSSEKQRGELASQWFSMEFVTNAFKGIKDSEFETDCRKFLNQVNGMLGDKRRVITYPCLSAFLGKYELQIPEDDNLEAFWIDFNTGSRSISFYVAADDEGHQWETVVIPEEEVETYLIEEEKDKKKLTVNIKNPIFVGDEEGEKIILYFDPALEILDAVRKVYAANKSQGFTKKNTMSVARTTVHVIFDESGSQVLVPESQISPLKEKPCKPMEDKCSYPVKRHHLPQNLNKEVNVDFQTPQSKMAPSKRKVSEASMTVPCTTRLPGQSPFQLLNTSSPRKGRIKMPLQMLSSAEQTDASSVLERRTMNFSHVEDSMPVSPITKSLQKNNIAIQKHTPVKKGIQVFHNEEDLDNFEKQNADELNDIVADSQPMDRNEKPLLPGLLENSTAEIKPKKKQMCWVPEEIISHCNRQNMSASGSTFYQASTLSDRAAKQRAFSSIFKMTSPTLRNTLCCSEEIMEQKQSETNKLPVTNGKTYCPESRDSLKHLEEEISKNNSSKIVPSKPQISLPSCRKTRSSVVNSELVIDANNEVGFDACSLGKETTNKKAEQKAKSKAVVEATDMLISKISDRYKLSDGAKSTRKLCQSFSHSRASLNKSGFSLSKKKSKNRGSKNLKSETVLNITTGHLTDDVYNFNLSGSDEPTIKLGIQEFHVTKLKATTSLSKKINHEDDGESRTQKKQDKKNGTNKNRKHLFSDTDTEYRGDDAKTDISWLQESSKKTKPQLVDYSRAKNQTKSKTLGANKSPGSTSIKRVFQQKKSKSKKSENNAAKNPPSTRLRQPRRAAKAKKCYKELSDSEMESEEESSMHLIKKDLTKEHAENRSINNKDGTQLNVKQRVVSCGATKGQSIKQTKKSSIKSNNCSPKNETALSPMSSPESPGSIEIMRSSEKAGEEESTQEHISMRRSSSSSSFLQELTPEKEGNLCTIKEIAALLNTNKESAQLNQPLEKGKKTVFENENLSPTLSPLSLPKLTPLTTRKKFPTDQDAEVVEFEDNISSADEAIIIKNDPLDKSSDTEFKEFSESFVNIRKKSCASPSQLSTPRSGREKRWHKELPAQLHTSGPTIYPNFKRLYRDDTESDSDEVEIRREEERKTKLLPRKLFKGDDNTCKVSESISTLSINDTSVFDGEGWDADSSNAGLICQKLHKEFARKIQSRSNRMDSFTKQSLKSAHQHLSTMSCELHQHRSQQLEQFHARLIDELETFEKDAQALKNVEKEFSSFSKKHTQIFSTYNKNEHQRLQALKTSFEKNVCRATECEENIFSSEMHLMKEDMKALQDKLLKEMREEELLNIRKGLQSLFMIEERKF